MSAHAASDAWCVQEIVGSDELRGASREVVCSESAQDAVACGERVMHPRPPLWPIFEAPSAARSIVGARHV